MRHETSIASLPAEILLHVFHFAQDDHDSHFPSEHPADSIFPFFRRRLNPSVALSHTSRNWRTLALCDTRLWRTLHLDGEIDEGRAEAKALLWAERATADAAHAADGPSGVSGLVVTRAQDWSPDEFAYLCDALDLMDLVQLRRARISWHGGGVAADEQRQLQSFLSLLVSSASTLASLTIHTPAHLRILFSLPRIGHTFARLEDLEIRSCKSSTPSTDVYLVPSFLPRFAGEQDWAPLAHLRRLVLVGPIWRLRFADGTVVSPVLGWEDVPALEYAHLGATTPPTHWALLSHASGTLRHLVLENFVSDHRHLEDPDVATVFPRLLSLELVNSAPLATRLLDLAVGCRPPSSSSRSASPGPPARAAALVTLPHLRACRSPAPSFAPHTSPSLPARRLPSSSDSTCASPCPSSTTRNSRCRGT
ncbi:uncharacterized protein RHOBADRAFT_52290 [Rhodotorula graminis WP1]|uniref:F-box domain-containing protein n=1 Tax=Rhodotorula graminis (strain WP1) TaxID=578459 RepID=A0A194SA25_RHOGW|nr:uncharacterized protein RHOBADRAFT_52290 [Rhodotorula graminis WP1]KPV76256.1 hypothetical protein RHOBADRAFT_52290 [Rhodotorula graminis WP1]